MKINYPLISILLAASLLAGCDNSSPYANDSNNNSPIAYDASILTFTDTPISDMFRGLDSDNDSLSFEVTVQPENGTLESSSDGSFTYSPLDEYTGSDEISFRVFDGLAYSSIAIVSINIDRRQENMSSYVRTSFAQMSSDKPTGINGRDFNQDLVSSDELQDLVDNGEQ